MSKAFSLIELVISVVIISFITFFAIPKIDNGLKIVTDNLLEHIFYTKDLALNDSLEFRNLHQTKTLKEEFPSLNETKLIQTQPMWQMQFHINGKYTQYSYSIYVDTPRFSPTTDYDNRPMKGDIIAISGIDQKCLSGYNNINTATICTNNASSSVRISEVYGVKLSIQADKFCKENLTARVYFDHFGVPYCGKNRIKLQNPFQIILEKNNRKTLICILPFTGYSFISKNGVC